MNFLKEIRFELYHKYNLKTHECHYNNNNNNNNNNTTTTTTTTTNNNNNNNNHDYELPLSFSVWSFRYFSASCRTEFSVVITRIQTLVTFPKLVFT